jgi:SNF2 family DNA or RNA helicase
LLRRVKTDVESSIPPKTELIVYTQLAGMQKDQYKNILKRDMDALYAHEQQPATPPCASEGSDPASAPPS